MGRAGSEQASSKISIEGGKDWSMKNNNSRLDYIRSFLCSYHRHRYQRRKSTSRSRSAE